MQWLLAILGEALVTIRICFENFFFIWSASIKGIQKRRAVGNNTTNVPLLKLQTARRSVGLHSQCCTPPTTVVNKSRVLNNRESSVTTIPLMCALLAITSNVIDSICGLFSAVCKHDIRILRQMIFFSYYFFHLFCQSLARSIWSVLFGIGSLVSFRTVHKIRKAGCIFWGAENWKWVCFTTDYLLQECMVVHQYWPGCSDIWLVMLPTAVSYQADLMV